MQQSHAISTLFVQCKVFLNDVDHMSAGGLNYQDLQIVLDEKEAFLKKIQTLLSKQDPNNQIFGDLEKEIEQIQEGIKEVDATFRQKLMTELDSLFQNASHLKKPKTASEIEKGEKGDNLSRTLSAYESLSLFIDRNHEEFLHLSSNFAHYVLAKQVAHYSNSQLTLERLEKVENPLERVSLEAILKLRVQHLNESLQVWQLQQFQDHHEIRNSSLNKNEKAQTFKKEMPPNSIATLLYICECMRTFNALDLLVQGIRNKAFDKESLAKTVSEVKAKLLGLEQLTKAQGMIHFKSVSLVHSLILERLQLFGGLTEMMLIFAAILDSDITKLKEIDEVAHLQSSKHFAKANELMQVKSLDPEKENELKQKIFEQIFSGEEVKQLMAMENNAFASLVAIFNSLTKDAYDLSLTIALAFTELNSGLHEDKPIEALEWDLLILLKNQFPDVFGSLEKLKRTQVVKIMASLTSNFTYHSIDLKAYKANALMVRYLKSYRPETAGNPDEEEKKDKKGADKENLNSLMSFKPQIFYQDDSEQQQVILSYRQHNQQHLEWCQQLINYMGLFTEQYGKMKPTANKGQETMVRVLEGIETPQSITQKIFQANERKIELEQAEQLCHILTRNLESLQDEIQVMEPLVVEFRVLEDMVPFYKANLTELIFLVKLNSPQATFEEIEEAIKIFDGVSEIFVKLEEEKHQLEELNPQMQEISQMYNKLTEELKEEEVNQFLDKFSANLHQMNAIVNTVKVEVQDKINLLLQKSAQCLKLSNLVTGSHLKTKSLQPITNLYLTQDKIATILQTFIEVNNQVSGSMEKFMAQVANVNQKIGCVSLPDYLIFLWVRDFYKDKDIAFNELKHTNLSEEQIGILRTTFDYNEEKYGASGLIFPAHLFSRDPGWNVNNKHIFEYKVGAARNGNRWKVVTILDSGVEQKVKKRDHQYVIENCKHTDGDFISEGSDRNYFSWRWFNIDGADRWTMTLEDGHGKVDKFTEEEIKPSQLCWSEPVEEGWVFNWRWFRRGGGESFKVLTIE